MAKYGKLNQRSIRLFTATEEEKKKGRPHLQAPYFVVPRSELEHLLELSNGDVVLSIGVWKRQGKEGKPDYFTAEVSYPDDAETQQKYLDKDEEWRNAHPATSEDNKRRRQYAMNRKAAEDYGMDANEDVPF